MKKINLLKIVPFIPIVLIAQESLTSQYLERYHKSISYWIMDGSDIVDRYLADTNDTKKLSKTRVKIAYEFGTNSKSGSSNTLDFGLSLSLPRLENKAKITLEKVNKTTGLFGNNAESTLSKKEDNFDDSYNLALKYSQWRGKKSSIALTGGIRFNKIFFEPYIGLIAGYTIINNTKENLTIKDTLRFYIAGEIKNNFSTQYLYNYSNDILLGWRGNFEYSNKSDIQNLISEFIWHKYIDEDKFIRVGFVSTATLTNFKKPKKDNFELYTKYHNKMLNKDWLFYEVTPSVDWKKEDNYKTSVGVKLKIGATFGGFR